MGRMKKADVIAELKAMGVVTATDDYNELTRLLKNEQSRLSLIDEADEQVISPQEAQTQALKLKFGEERYARARKIGLSDEQIATYSDPAALYIACQNIKPQATAQVAEPVERKAPVRQTRGVLTQIEYTSTVSEMRARNINRVGYDDMQMNSFLRKQRIELRNIQRVSIDRIYVPDRKGILTTKMIIVYLKRH